MPDKQTKDEALAEIVPEPRKREVFRGIMSDIAKQQSADMSGEQRKQRARKAAEARWGKKKK